MKYTIGEVLEGAVAASNDIASFKKFSPDGVRILSIAEGHILLGCGIGGFAEEAGATLHMQGGLPGTYPYRATFRVQGILFAQWGETEQDARK